MKKISFLVTCCMMSFFAKGQDSLLWTQYLEDIVITGQFSPQSARQSVYQVKTIPQKRISNQGATRLQDVLQTELNIRFSQDLALGESTLSMQGLSGQYVKVLIDGVPMVGRQGTTNAININQIDVNSVERIEIVEGPMSVIYGADALAGVINIITKKPEENQWSINARIQEETVGREYSLQQGIHNHSLNASFHKNRIYMQGGLTRNSFGGWRGEAEGRDREWHPKEQWLGHSLVGYRTSNLHVYYRLDLLDEIIDNKANFNGNEAIDQEYLTQRAMHQIQTEGSISDRLNFNGSLAFTSFERRTRSTVVNRQTGDRRLALGEGRQDVNTFEGINARGTMTYTVSDKLSLQPGYEINLEYGEGGRIKEGVQSIQEYAFFASAEYKPTDWLSVRGGTRVIQNLAYTAPPLVPSLNLKFKISQQMNFRLAYGRGFRAPSIRELYFNFFDASHAIEGNPNLTPELSHSVNGVFTWNPKNLAHIEAETSLQAFYNNISQMIGLGQKPGNAIITSYVNIDRFKTQGLIWNNSFATGHTRVAVGASYVGRYNQLRMESEEATDFTWTPEVNTNISQELPSVGMTLSVFYKYTGRMPFYELVNTDMQQSIRLAHVDGFHWADITLRKQFGEALDISAGVRNVLNIERINSTAQATGAHVGNGPRPIGYGRSYFISLNYTFSK